ncbi:MAG: RdgB/HAM1 family non-canonical purine NTP pyrophosphatase [Bacteroidetes bacterium]|nr:RdgB/HAM1 family non-canonical purine NTP pyrophosphatase [Bacteroidota bacterium]
MKLIFATNNLHKVEEMQASIGQAFQLITLKQAGIDIDIPEPHDTLEANASEKSRTIHQLTGIDCFSEDTGLEAEALDGEPGVLSARYAGDAKAPEKNIQKLLDKLAAQANRRARFRTVISLILDNQEHLFEGICPGTITTTPRGNGGFGYDPVFVPDEDTRTFGEMNMDEKGQYSHRRRAADKLVLFLQNHAR